MKKAVVLIAAVLMIVSCFTACMGEGYPISADGNRISAGVYAYHLSQTKDAGKTVEICKTSAATEKLMKTEGVTLSANYKRLIAEETDSKWSLFSSYYESMGISKQDITQALTFDYNKKELLDYYYGEKGKTPVSDEKIKSQLDKIYVGFKAIEASYLKVSDMGESVSLSDAEKKNLRSRFEAMAKSINSSVMTINDANKAYNESIGIIVTQNPETALIKQGDVLYDDSFFDEVSKLKKGEAAVVESGNSVFLIQRQVITDDDDGFVFIYHSEMLESLKMKALEKKISEMAHDLEIKTNKRLCKEIEERVL